MDLHAVTLPVDDQYGSFKGAQFSSSVPTDPDGGIGTDPEPQDRILLPNSDIGRGNVYSDGSVVFDNGVDLSAVTIASAYQNSGTSSNFIDFQWGVYFSIYSGDDLYGPGGPGSSVDPNEFDYNCPYDSTPETPGEISYATSVKFAWFNRMLDMQADRDNVEYNGLVYIGHDGQIKTTLLERQLNTSAPWAELLNSIPKNGDGNPDYTKIVGFVHSHPRYYNSIDNYNPNNDDRLDRPSIPDWARFDEFRNAITLQGGDASKIIMGIIGYSSAGHTTHQYTNSDRSINSENGSKATSPIDKYLAGCG